MGLLMRVVKEKLCMKLWERELLRKKDALKERKQCQVEGEAKLVNWEILQLQKTVTVRTQCRTSVKCHCHNWILRYY